VRSDWLIATAMRACVCVCVCAGPPGRAAKVRPGEEGSGDRETQGHHLPVGGEHRSSEAYFLFSLILGKA